MKNQIITFWRWRSHWAWGETRWQTIQLNYSDEDLVKEYFDGLANNSDHDSEHFRRIEWEEVVPTKGLLEKSIYDREVRIKAYQHEIEELRRMLTKLSEKEKKVVVLT